MGDSSPLTTYPYPITYKELWLLQDTISPTFAGWSGRSETAEPWHGESLLRKVWYALTRFDDSGKGPDVVLDLTEGELRAIAFNLPRTAAAEAKDMLQRAFQLMASAALGFSLRSDEPGDVDRDRLLEIWKASQYGN